jgi:class 3 adenylate cyclase
VVIQRVNTALNSARALDEIMTRLTTILRREIFLDTAGVVIKDPHKNHCQALLISDGPKNHLDQVKELCVTLDDPLLALLSRERRLITKYDVAEDPRFGEVREACGRRFAELGASVAIPLIHQEQVTGLLAVGYKKSGHFYTREDIDLLTSVADQGAVAIEQVRETAQRATLMQLFSKHVSPEVAESLWQQRDQFLDGGRPRPQKLLATILFTDLQGFSSVSEKQEPQVLMDWLNTYMEALATKVMEHHGVVDNYIGDAVKADFGVPLPRTTEAELREDATNAVACALAMEREVIRLNAVMESRGLPTLRMRVGINTGPVVAGSLGSSDRLKYTTLGDAVNTASRLESYDKALVIPELDDRPCRILVSRATLMFLGDAFDTRRVGELALKGKEQMIDVYCVLGRAVGTPAIPALTESV